MLWDYRMFIADEVTKDERKPFVCLGKLNFKVKTCSMIMHKFRASTQTRLTFKIFILAYNLKLSGD